MNLYFRFLMVFVFVVIATGCSEAKKNENDASSFHKEDQLKKLGPEETLIAYLEAVEKAGLDGKSKETYRFLSSEDQKAVSLEEHLSDPYIQGGQVSDKFLDLFDRQTSYSVKKSSIDGDNAKVKVETTVPKIQESFWDSLREGNLSREQERKVVSYLQSPDITTRKFTEEYNLVKENDGWKVFYDFATRKQVDALVNEAKNLAPPNKMISLLDGSDLVAMKSELLSAEEKYEQALSIGDSWFAENELKSLREQIQKLEFYEKYKEKLSIKNIRVGEGQGGTRGVFGEVKNQGETTLSTVQITIYFLDNQGNPVHEKSYHPVLASADSYRDSSKPLKPNYTRKFGVRADDAPSDWSGEVKVVISDVEQQ